MVDGDVGQEQRRVRETVIALSDDAILQMLAASRDQYTPFVLDVARQELTRRGGHEAVQQRIAEEASQETLAEATEDSAVQGAGRTNMVFGALWCIGGIAVTAVTYHAASSGGTYIVAWGAILFGGLQFLRGVIQVASTR